jgi:hypothetical protein
MTRKLRSGFQARERNYCDSAKSGGKMKNWKRWNRGKLNNVPKQKIVYEKVMLGTYEPAERKY